MLSLLHPGFLLIIFALLVHLKKQWHNWMSITAPIFAIALLIAKSLATNSPLLVLNSIENLMCFSLLTVLLVNNIFIILNCKTKDARELQLSLLYIGAGLYIVTSQDLLSVFLSLELMMIAGGSIIFTGKSKQSKKSGLNYIKIHLLSGTLFLIGIIIRIASQKSLLITPYMPHEIATSEIVLLSGLFINIALPPFSYWLTEGYPSASPFGSIILSVCMTKVSAMLLVKMFLSSTMLIYLGIFMGFYGVAYMLLETNIRKFVTFTIISETGLILIAIGVGSSNVAYSLIIANIFYTAILMTCASRISLFSYANHYFEIKHIPQKNLMMSVYIITLLSVAAFPMTPGYINKYNLNLAIELTKRDWLVNTITALNFGMIFAAFFKTIDFIFFAQKTKHKNGNSRTIQNAPELYILTIFSVILSFLVCLVLKLTFKIDKTIIKQLCIFLIATFLFIRLKKYFFFSKPITLIEPDFIYRKFLFIIYDKIKSRILSTTTALRHNKDKCYNTGYTVITKLMGPQGAISYSKYLSNTIILVIIILIFFLIHI